MGLPDLGVITVDEVAFFIRQVARSGLPVMVDGDTGYGELLNVMHMVRTFEDAGAAAVHIEDQLLPKKCGHLNDKKLADPRDMATKIAAAVKARRDLYVIARTDAAASEGIDGAVARGQGIAARSLRHVSRRRGRLHSPQIFVRRRPTADGLRARRTYGAELPSRNDDFGRRVQPSMRMF
jgi:hypothetical protein